MTTLVLCEHDGSRIKPATLNTLTAAKCLSQPIDVLVAGHQVDEVGQQAAKLDGVRRVIQADGAEYQHDSVENVAHLIHKQLAPYTHVFAPATTYGKAILPYVGGLADLQPISDISKVIDDHTFERPTYAGNVIMRLKSNDSVKLIGVRSTAFEASSVGEQAVASIEKIEAQGDLGHTEFMESVVSDQEKPDLTTAKIVISGGRGMQSGEHFSLLQSIADKLGAAVGASRAAVDAGYVSNDYQVGQTGKVVAPDVYVAVGISGAIQHLAGMKDSKVIVAINKDEEAPIFQIADYGWVADLFEALPLLERALDSA